MPPVPEPEVPIVGIMPFEEESCGYSDEETLLLRDFDSDLTLSSYGLLQKQGQDQEDDVTSSSFCSNLWEAYYHSLQQRPLLVKSVTAFFLMGCADCLAQLVEVLKYNIVFHIDWMRTLRFAIFGLVGAPWTHYYYDWLDTVLPPTLEPWTWTTAIKVVIDQFLQAPILLALIIMGMALMEGNGISGMMNDLHKQYISTLIENWKLWIPATIVNIAFVKPELRVLYDNLIFFGWTIILSMILNSPSDTS